MKYFDKNISKWHRKQESMQSDDNGSRSSKRDLRRRLDSFSIKYIQDKYWWKSLSYDEMCRVYQSFENTHAAVKVKLCENDPTYTTWYSYDPDIADVSGDSWEECVPQWLEYVKNKYPLDANVRRELAIRRIFS